MASGWPMPRIEHWSMLARARAIEDQAWVVACNTAGTHAGVQMGGRSVVVDPRGTVVAEAGYDEEILYADVDPARRRRSGGGPSPCSPTAGSSCRPPRPLLHPFRSPAPRPALRPVSRDRTPG